MEIRPNFSEHAERLVLAHIAASGRPAIQLCAEAALKDSDFHNQDAALIYAKAVELNVSDRLFAGGFTILESCREITPARFVELTRMESFSDMPSAELPRACRELKRLSASRQLKRNVEVAREAVIANDDEKIRAALNALGEAEIESKPRATWLQTARVELERA